MNAPKKVAIIHKDSELIGVLADMAKTLGCTTNEMIVSGDTRAAEVASFVRYIRPNLVLLAESYRGGRFDLSLPQGGYMGEGLEALTEIRRTHPNLPVFMVSGNPLYAERARQEGANGYLQIPITVEEFRRFIKSNTQS